MTGKASHELHHDVWSAYRRALGTDASWDAAAAFQVAVDLLLQHRPGVDPRAACDAAARMVMMRPRGIAPNRRAVPASITRPTTPPGDGIRVG